MLQFRVRCRCPNHNLSKIPQELCFEFYVALVLKSCLCFVVLVFCCSLMCLLSKLCSRCCFLLLMFSLFAGCERSLQSSTVILIASLLLCLLYAVAFLVKIVFLLSGVH